MIVPTKIKEKKKKMSKTTEFKKIEQYKINIEI